MTKALGSRSPTTCTHTAGLGWARTEPRAVSCAGANRCEPTFHSSACHYSTSCARSAALAHGSQPAHTESAARYCRSPAGACCLRGCYQFPFARAVGSATGLCSLRLKKKSLCSSLYFLAASLTPPAASRAPGLTSSARAESRASPGISACLCLSVEACSTAA